MSYSQTSYFAASHRLKSGLCAALILGFAAVSAPAATVLYEATLGTTVTKSYLSPSDFPFPLPGANTADVNVTGNGPLVLNSSTDTVSVHFSLPEGYRMEVLANAARPFFQVGVSFATGGSQVFNFTQNTVSVTFDNLVGTPPSFAFDGYTHISFFGLRTSVPNLSSDFSFTGMTLTFNVQGITNDYSFDVNGFTFIFQDQNYYGAPPPNTPDLLRITNIPEPSSMVFLGAGFLSGALLLARRKKRFIA